MTTIPHKITSPAVAPLKAKTPPWWALVVIFFMALGSYQNSLHNGFVFDDGGIIASNPVVQEEQWDRVWTGDYWPTQEGPHDVLYRPLAVFSYVLNQHFTPNNPLPFHAVNIVLHALVSVLVVLLALRLLGDRWAALLAGLAFAVHPIHTEAVANVVGRAELMSTLFALLAILLFLPERADWLAGAPAPRPWWHGALVGACALGSLFSKETPATFVLALLPLDLIRWNAWPVPKPALGEWLKRQAIRYYLPVAFAFCLYLAARVMTVGLMMDTRQIHPEVNPLVRGTLPERLFTPFFLLHKYVVLTCWPKVLSADYSSPSIRNVANPLRSSGAMLGLLIAGVLAAGIVTRWRKSPRVVAVALLFALSLTLILNVIRIGTIFGERLFYYPSCFLLILAAAAGLYLWRSARNVPYRSTLTAALVLVTVLMVRRTRARNLDWESNEMLAISTAIDNPASAKADAWAGKVLANAGSTEEYRALGLTLLKQTIELAPDFAEGYWQTGAYYLKKHDMGHAVVYMSNAARYDGGKLSTRRAIKELFANMKKMPAAEYLPTTASNAADKPKDPAAHLAYGLGLWASGDLKKADAELYQALKLDTNFAEVVAEIGLLKKDEGQPDDAVRLLRGYVLNVRFNAAARCDLADALMSVDLKQHPAALEEAGMNLRQAQKLTPEDKDLFALRARLVKLLESRSPRAAASGAPINYQIPSPRAAAGAS